MALELKARAAKTQYISQYVTDLRQIIGYYLPWVPEFQHDAESFFDIMENDMEIGRCLNLLALMTAGEYFEVKTKDTLFAKIITRGLSHIKNFVHARKSMTQKMIIYGLTVQKKTWKKVKWDEFGEMVWEVPVSITEVDRRRMRVERQVYEVSGRPSTYSKPYWTIWDPETDSYVVLEDKNKSPLAKHYTQQYMWLRYEHEETSPYGRGLGEVMYTLAYMKKSILQQWAELGEKWGQPMLIATINAVKAAFNGATYGGGGMLDANNLMSKWLDILENMRSRHVACKTEDDKIEVHQGGQTGQNILQQLIQYIDTKIELLILGAQLTTGAPSVGSYALGQAHKGVTHSIVQYNQEIIQEEITTDLIYDFYLRNRTNFLALKIKWPGLSGINFKIRIEKEDQQQEMMDKMGEGGNSKMMKSLGM